MNWEKMTQHKSKDVMGFHNLQDFNISMLGRQG